MLTDILKDKKSFVIYGAQVIAYGAYTAIKGLTGRYPEVFVVGKTEGNPESIDGIKVSLIDEISKDTFIVVSVTELIQGEVIPYLKNNGYKNIFALTQHEEHLLMSAYFKKIGKFPLIDKNAANTPVDLALYEVKNHRDKPLTYPPKLYDFEKSIQAGAAITDLCIAPFADNSGENISSKNKQYCEMSAAYWVWKNTDTDWKGIEHYRRHLLIKPEMLSDDIDVVLPLPYICYPNTLSQFRRFVSEEVVQALFKALRDLHPENYDRYLEILNGHYQYTYNMVCAKKTVFSDYCTWFFNITNYMETMGDEVPAIKETRALSYAAEVLTNLYFMSNADKLRIRHIEKAIYT